MLTLSASLQALAFGLLALESKNAVGEGLSEKTLWAFFIAHVTRLSTTVYGEGYVPEDNTADVYLYQILELTGVLVLTFQLLKISATRTMHEAAQESWNMLIISGVVSLVMAWFTRSTGHNDLLADVSWMFS